MCGNDIEAAVNTVTSNPTVKSASNAGSGLADAVATTLTNVLTFGGQSYDKGKLKSNDQNAYLHGLSESVGEVSGRNAARKQIMEQKDAVAAEVVVKNNQIKNEQTRKGLLDVQASTQAGLIRQSTMSQQRNYLGAGDPSRDFLGL